MYFAHSHILLTPKEIKTNSPDTPKRIKRITLKLRPNANTFGSGQQEVGTVFMGAGLLPSQGREELVAWKPGGWLWLFPLLLFLQVPPSDSFSAAMNLADLNDSKRPVRRAQCMISQYLWGRSRATAQFSWFSVGGRHHIRLKSRRQRGCKALGRNPLPSPVELLAERPAWQD